MVAISDCFNLTLFEEFKIFLSFILSKDFEFENDFKNIFYLKCSKLIEKPQDKVPLSLIMQLNFIIGTFNIFNSEDYLKTSVTEYVNSSIAKMKSKEGK